MKPDDKKLLGETLFVKPLPFVKEVIFLATPQRGSYLAGPQFVRRLAAYFVRLPSDLVRVGADLATHRAERRGRALVRQAADQHRQHVAEQSLHQDARADPDRARCRRALDHLRRLRRPARHGRRRRREVRERAHRPASSRSWSCAALTRACSPRRQTVEEVRRIFLEHSAKSACPLPIPTDSRV